MQLEGSPGLVRVSCSHLHLQAPDLFRELCSVGCRSARAQGGVVQGAEVPPKDAWTSTTYGFNDQVIFGGFTTVTFYYHRDIN